MSGTVLEDAPPRNLFTPRFGHSPHQVVGRDYLMRRLSEALRSGSGHKHRTTLILGSRGSGKTVVLNAAEDHAASLGYAVISVDAGTPGTAERILDRARVVSVGEAPSPALPAAARHVRIKAGIRLGPLSVSRETERRKGQHAAVREDMRTVLGDLAERVVAAGGAGVLLTVDEMHRIDLDEMIRLANDLQHVTSRDEAPVMFVGGSLPDIGIALSDDRLSFFRRCADEPLPGLDAADAYAFISGTIQDAGGGYDHEALLRLTSAVGPLPYEMQLLGDYAWRFAAAPLRPVGHDAVDAALRHTSAEMHAKVYGPLWERLDGDERAVLIAVADSDGVIARGDLGAALSGMWASIDGAVRRLEHRGCLVADLDDLDTLVLGSAISLSAARREARITSSYQPPVARPGPVAASAPLSPRCGKMMPRSQKRCVLRRRSPRRLPVTHLKAAQSQTAESEAAMRSATNVANGSMPFAQQRRGVCAIHDLLDGETNLLESTPVAQRCHSTGAARSGWVGAGDGCHCGGGPELRRCVGIRYGTCIPPRLVGSAGHGGVIFCPCA